MTVFVFAPAQYYTGGITALYQLCRSLNNYMDAKIVFIDTFSDEKIENYIHQNYLHFGCAHISQSKVHDSKNHIIVIPESRPDLIAKYKFSKKILYWLSVDNFLMSISPISRSIRVNLLINLLLRGRFDLVWFAGLSKFKQYLKHDHTYRRILGNAVKGEYYSSFARDKKVQIPPADIHLLQSCHVYYFLTNFIEKSKMFFLHEPLEDDYLNFSASKDRKEDIVTWNARKAYPVTLKIIKALKKNKVRVIALENVGKSNMINILGKSKIFIDIGLHPGRDRPPREAVALGNIVIVNNHGGCFYYDDCMIEPPFKVDCYTESRCNIDPKKVAEDILHYMENYEYYYKKYFAKFREHILEEPKLYQKEIEQLTKILSDIRHYKMSKIVVLGCGYAGLLVAIKAKRSNSSAEVLCIDRDFAGGLLRSVALNGFVFDVGGSHVVFSKRREIVEGILSLGGEWVRRERLAYVYMDGEFIPYPFENGIYVLPAELRVRYGLSILKALISSSGERPRNLREWIVNTFGEEVASDYLIPYNEKIWKRPLEQISADWAYIRGRLPLPSLEDIVKAIAGLPTVGYREQAVFYYPRKGGIVEQWRAAYRRAEELGVKFLQMEVREVKKVGSEFLINGVVKADKVISTLPLREAPAIFGLSEESFSAAERLDYNSVVVVGVGLNSPAPKQHWIYVPDRRVPFHRYAWISNYGEDLPPNKSALIAEITVPPSEKVDVNALKHETVRWLAELEVIREEDIAVVAAWFHKYGYPIYTLSHSKDTQIIEGELREIGVITFGRWGNWQYWNTDKIYEKSMDLHL